MPLSCKTQQDGDRPSGAQTVSAAEGGKGSWSLFKPLFQGCSRFSPLQAWASGFSKPGPRKAAPEFPRSSGSAWADPASPGLGLSEPKGSSSRHMSLPTA